MKTIHNMTELTIIAKMVSASGEGEMVKADLTEEIVDFLHSIGGKNRELSAANLADIHNVIKSGLWDENESRIVVNSSLTWMPCGHHRIEVMFDLKPAGLKTLLHILPDKQAENVYLHDDVIVKKRSADRQAKEFFHVSCAKDVRATIGYIKKNTGHPDTTVLPSEIRDYWNKNESLLMSHRFLSHLPTFGGSRGRKMFVPRFMYAIAIHLHDIGSAYENDAWHLIDELHNVNTEVLAAKILKDTILTQGQGESTDAPRIFIKSIVVGSDNIKSPTQLYVRVTEKTDKYRDALRLTNSDNHSSESLVGSRNYYVKVLRKIRKEAK